MVEMLCCWSDGCHVRPGSRALCSFLALKLLCDLSLIKNLNKNPKERPCCKNGKERAQSSALRPTACPRKPSWSSFQWSQGRGPGGSRWRQSWGKEHFMMPAVVMMQAGVILIALEDMCCSKDSGEGDGQGTEPMPQLLPALEDQLSSCLQI